MLDSSAAFAVFPVLETERLLLRAVAPDDASAILRIMGDPQVMRYFGTAPMESLDAAAQRVERIAAAFAAQEGLRWALVEKESGAFIGSGGFWRIDRTHFRAEIGYELAAASWGRGYMPEALAAILSFGFSTLGLHSVEAQIHPDNGASRRVLEKLGFVQEGYFRENYYEPHNGIFTDTAVFSLLKTARAPRA